jgi:RNA polymerase sigma-70 factor (ECF subfamily)
MPTAPEDWVTRASQGDEAAIERLLVQYWPDIAAYFARHLPGPVEAPDLAQSVCREVLAHLRDGRLRFAGEPQFRQWLYRAAALKLMEHRRKRGRQAERALPLASDSSAGGPPVGDATSPSQAAELHEHLEAFVRAFGQLEPRQAQVFLWHHLEGRPHAEIAQRLGIEVSHSRTLLARALARLSALGAQPS